jgi:hypothetical protein
MTTQQTEKLKEVRKEWLGMCVEVVNNKSFGTGEVIIGDKGIVVDVESEQPVSDNYVLTLDILPDYKNSTTKFYGSKGWRCYISDVSKSSTDRYVNEKIKNIQQFFSKLPQIYKNKKTEVLNQIGAKQEEISKLYIDLANINTIIRSKNTKASNMTPEKIRNQCLVIQDMYSSVKIADNYLVATTYPVNMEYIDHNGDKQLINMGVYRVEIDLANGISIYYETGGYPSNYRNEFIHPHIRTNNMICWGTWYSTLSENLVEHEYINVLRIVYNFLSTCTPSDWFINGLAFSKDNENLCNECWEHLDDCECNRCESCGENLDDCKCRRCPDSGELILSNIHCDGCNSYNESDGCTY